MAMVSTPEGTRYVPDVVRLSGHRTGINGKPSAEVMEEMRKIYRQQMEERNIVEVNEKRRYVKRDV